MYLYTNSRGTKVPHTYIVPESKISDCFALRTAVLELEAIERQVHRITPK